MKIVTMTDWPESQRDALHQRWMQSVGFGIGPYPSDVLDAMIADGVVDVGDLLPPGTHAVGYRYDDDDGSSLRVLFEPNGGGGDDA